MRLWTRIASVLAFVPLMAAAQFNDLDTAVSNLTRGFGNGDPQAIVAGIAAGDKVNLEFPGLVEQSGFFGRDQAAYLLDGLFSKVHPTGFEQQSARRVSAEGQYYITASWSIQPGGKADTRELYITLKKQGDKWAVTSVRSGGK
jgi:ketosteroid isomerase-like protein